MRRFPPFTVAIMVIVKIGMSGIPAKALMLPAMALCRLTASPSIHNPYLYKEAQEEQRFQGWPHVLRVWRDTEQLRGKAKIWRQGCTTSTVSNEKPSQSTCTLPTSRASANPNKGIHWVSWRCGAPKLVIIKVKPKRQQRQTCSYHWT